MSEADFHNTYEDSRRAHAYDQLEWGGTYLLVYTTLPRLLNTYARGRRALDCGCGTGRSTRLLKSLGFDPIGIDISSEMVAIAQKKDPAGDYRVITDGDFSTLQPASFDLIVAAFPFDNIPGHDRKLRLLRGLKDLLRPQGILVNIVSTPEIYIHEWVTFTTKDFPENRHARCGDIVRIVTCDYSDQRPVDDIIWPDADYQKVYHEAGLTQICAEAPLASGTEGVAWKSETSIAPWRLYVLGATECTRQVYPTS